MFKFKIMNSIVLSNSEQRLSNFIFENPQIVAKILQKNGISITAPLTLTKITNATFKNLYLKNNTKLQQDLNVAIINEGYSNFDPITLGVTAGLSIVSSIVGGNAAKKQREAMYKIALANLSQQKLLKEEEIRTGAETERTKILLQTLQQYQSDLQSQSTQRIKDVWIYTGGIAAGIAIIYGVSILLTSKPTS